MNTLHTLNKLSQAAPSAGWSAPVTLTKNMIDRYRQKQLVIDQASRRIDINNPDFPDSSLAFLLKAQDEGWLNRQDLKERLIERFYPGLEQLEEAQRQAETEEFDTPDYRDDVAKLAYGKILAGAACSSESDKSKILSLIKEAVGGSHIDIINLQSALVDLRGTDHTPLSLLDLPLAEQAYRDYRELFEIKEPVLREIIAADRAPEFKMVLEMLESAQLRDQVNNLIDNVGERPLADSKAIRQYLYDRGHSTLDEDVYSRLLGAVEKMDEDYPFTVDEQDIPEGFFDRYGDQIWYETIEALQKSNFTMNRLGEADRQAAIRALSNSLVILFKHHSFYPALMAKTLGRNLASLNRYRQQEQPDLRTALSAMVDFLGCQCYSVTGDDLVDSGIGVMGKLKPFLAIRAMHRTFNIKDIERALKDDGQRILFYRAASNTLYLRQLENKRFGDQLMGQDLGL
ncbi:hypothetical protein [Pseudomonas sp. CFBP 13719]|uniref:hypothetical protein n=1 Tax=Pseudomonas sp. CFBP 13719 TaxID=2775303 RepID=UPI0017823843|nr:hypothetical protein [Pseudomonas sp. CFBP 13719]MBD8681674.1 hypothetical protein [Pseudomonas sp. CFBP 13719]